MTGFVSKLLLCLLVSTISYNAVLAFTSVVAPLPLTTVTKTDHHAALFSSHGTSSDNNNNINLDRRTVLQKSTATIIASAFGVVTTVGSDGVLTASTDFSNNYVANAIEIKKVVVAGATGQTGRRILERLVAVPGISVVGGVRSVAKATETLQNDSTVIRGAMIQKINSIDSSNVQLKHLDVVKDSVNDIATNALVGADALIIATGFIPGNPFKMNEAAHQVDNLGTIALINAAIQTGTIKKIVMVSSILTNGRNWGQENSPGFVVTNAFGNVLDEKLVAENYLKTSNIDYTIVRPGGLKAKPPSGSLVVSKEDTLNSGEISRDLVADVCIAALTDTKVSNKVIEIIENDETGPKVFNGINM